jgi:hypothetical protein
MDGNSIQPPKQGELVVDQENDSVPGFTKEHKGLKNDGKAIDIFVNTHLLSGYS